MEKAPASRGNKGRADRLVLASARLWLRAGGNWGILNGGRRDSPPFKGGPLDATDGKVIDEISRK